MTINDIHKYLSELIEVGKGDYDFCENVFFHEVGDVMLDIDEHDITINDEKRYVVIH